jgi:hypothetical protein
MGDVGERPGVNEGGSPFEGLHQVRLDGVLHQNGQRASHAEVFSSHGLPLFVSSNHHTSEPVAHICQVSGEGQNRHDLGCHGDVEAGAVLMARFILAQPHLNLAQEAVIGIYHTPPGEAIRVDIEPGKAAAFLGRQFAGIGLLDAQFLQAAQHAGRESAFTLFVGRAERVEEFLVIGCVGLMEHARIQRSGAQVMRGGDGVDVAGQVQVEVLHGDNLAVTAAGRSTFNAKGRALGRLANAGEYPLAQVCAQRLAQADHRCALAFPQWRGGDGGHVNVLAVLAFGEPVEDFELDLGLIRAKQLELAFLDAQFLRDLQNGLEFPSLGDFNIGRDGADQFQLGGCKRKDHLLAI